jgi:riboflavin kinase/FMN adenylyltransferase
VRVYRSLDELPADTPRSVAIGTFDGVHRGHRAIIGAAVARARELGCESLVLTFDPHPAAVVRPDRAPERLCSLESELELMADTGVDAVLVVPFTRELASTEAATFVDEILAGRAGARHVEVGENFRFGHRAAGDADLLAARGVALGFTVHAHPLVVYDGQVVSSSRIRTLVMEGDMEGAVRLLGGPLPFDGVVEAGRGRGRGLGIPTANLPVPEGRVTPATGVYVADAHLPAGGGRARAAVSVGTNPTFERAVDAQVVVEAFLLDFDGDLYGGRLRLDLWRRLRPEIAYPSATELMEQVDRDIAATREFAPPPL